MTDFFDNYTMTINGASVTSDRRFDAFNPATEEVVATVPDATREELRRLVKSYLVVACVSGRSGEDAGRLVGVKGIEVD